MAQPRPSHLHPVPPSQTLLPGDLGGELTHEAFPLIPEGEYTAAYVGAEDREQYKAWRRYLFFEIVALEPGRAPYHGLRLPLICNMKKKGRFSAQGKYVALWTRVAGRRPTRHDRLTTRVFERRLYRILVRTVVKDHEQRPRDELSQYSVADAIVTIEAGGRQA